MIGVMGQTKKDKIITDLRRQVENQKRRNQQLRAKLKPPTKKSSPSQPKKQAHPQAENISNHIKTNPTIGRNLTKSFVLAILILSFEFILYSQIK